jgi:uncharacterized protein (DUF58 family)
MASGRGVAVIAAGLAMWLAGRLLGSSGLGVVGVGLAALPFASALFARWGRQRIAVSRRLSEVRVQPGMRVRVDVEVENRSHAPTSFLLVEDRLPSALGRSARLVLSGLPGRGRQRVWYTILPQARGRYVLGPTTLDVSDPFALTRLRLEFDERDELLVTPEIEDLTGSPSSPFGSSIGNSRAKQLFRTGEEFFTMRVYQEGDDLRRIHWPSVARTRQLMIRQDESSRRSSAVVFLDNRESAIGQTHGPAFERAVSCAASLGVLAARNGFTLRLATADTSPAPLTEETLLDALAGISHVQARSIGPALSHLRAGSSAETTLIAVSAPLLSEELTSLIRTGTAFGPKLAVLVYPADPGSLPPERQAQLEGRASQARLNLSRAGWDVLVLAPSGRLRDVWHAARDRALAFSV